MSGVFELFFFGRITKPFAANLCQGNKYPGSIFRSGAISEWPKILLFFILYFVCRLSINDISDFI